MVSRVPHKSEQCGRSTAPSPIVAGLALSEEHEGGGRAGGPARATRAFDRHPINRRVIVTELDALGAPGVSWACRAVDISRCGVGLRSRRMSYLGRGMFVEFLAEGGAPGKLLFGVVQQSRYAEGEGYAIGVEFAKPPETLAVRDWCARRGSGEGGRGRGPGRRLA